jgi:DNA-binding XRE family transcriptional regulator
MQRKVDFQKLLRRIRKKTGWTYGTIAAHIEVNLSTLHAIERGESKEPRYHLGARLVELERQVC